MTKQINVELDFVAIAMIEELKKVYNSYSTNKTYSTADVIESALACACEKFNISSEDIIDAYKKYNAD